MMEIKVCRSTELSKKDWESYTLGFNETMHRDFSSEFLKNKYLSVYKGYSCHAMLVADNGDIVGGTTVIPCFYQRESERFVCGLAVDVYIREAFREDPLALRKMYKKLLPLLQAEEVVAVIAVPNATAYSYWKNVVKWKDVGSINYWMLPVRAGKILGKRGIVGDALNFSSLCYCCLVYAVSAVTSLFNSKDRSYKYSICKDDPYYVGKFRNASYVKKDGYMYKLENEDGVKAGYMITAETDGRRTARDQFKCISAILKNEVDIILYVGKLGFFQTLMLKVPKKFEPKLLPFTCDLISKEEKYQDMLDICNWDFGLQNYDVR